MLNRYKVWLNPLLNRLGRWKVEHRFSVPPIILGGCGRSGTTLLLAILGAHPHIYTMPKESKAFLEWEKVEEEGMLYRPKRLDRFYRYILSHKIPPQANRWCEKTPRNVLAIDKFIAFFEDDLKFIHLIRDGRDVTLSRHPADPDDYWVTPQRWVQDVRAGLKFKDHPQVLTIKYEELVEAYEEVMKNVCAFLNEEWHDRLLNWTKYTNVKSNRAWFDNVKEVHSQSIGKWKREKNRGRVEQVMENKEFVKLLEELNYM